MGYSESRDPTPEELKQWPDIQRVITKMTLTGVTEVYRPANPIHPEEARLQAGLRGMQTGKDLGRQRQITGGQAQSLTSQMEAQRRELKNQRLAITALVGFLRSFGT